MISILVSSACIGKEMLISDMPIGSMFVLDNRTPDWVYLGPLKCGPLISLTTLKSFEGNPGATSVDPRRRGTVIKIVSLSPEQIELYEAHYDFDT
jgi:hypothetical protein